MKAIDLSRWQLRLPFAATDPVADLAPRDGGEARSASSEYFRFDSDGALTFVVPAATRSDAGSEMLACELREFADRVGARSWNSFEGGYLSASLRVNEVPEAPHGRTERIAIGRIGGADGQTCVLYYDAGGIYLSEGQQLQAQTAKRIDLQSSSGGEATIPVGDRFDYFVELAHGKLLVSVIHDGVTFSAHHPLDRNWLASPLHFSVGVTVSSRSIRGNASVTFFAISQPLAEAAVAAGKRDRRKAAPRAIASARLVLTMTDGEEIELPLDVETITPQ